jgi:hypothetical protein
MVVHKCSVEKCPSRGKAGTSHYIEAESFSRVAKVKDGERKILNKHTNWMRFETFAREAGYIDVHWCADADTTFHTITNKGIELTDNLLIPFTPIGLWKAIYEEHKVFGRLMVAVVSSIVLSASGLTLALAIKGARGILGI